jgi:hypothetical protein
LGPGLVDRRVAPCRRHHGGAEHVAPQCPGSDSAAGRVT